MSAGTGNPLGPLPVRLEFRSLATVNVAVYALSGRIVCVELAAAQFTSTTFAATVLGSSVVPSSVVGPMRVTLTCSMYLPASTRMMARVVSLGREATASWMWVKLARVLVGDTKRVLGGQPAKGEAGLGVWHVLKSVLLATERHDMRRKK